MWTRLCRETARRAALMVPSPKSVFARSIKQSTSAPHAISLFNENWRRASPSEVHSRRDAWRAAEYLFPMPKSAYRPLINPKLRTSVPRKAIRAAVKKSLCFGRRMLPLARQ